MKTKSVVVESEVETFQVDQPVTDDTGVDPDRLALAIAGYRQAVSDREAHDAALLALNARCEELDSEIFDIEAAISNKTNLADLSIAGIKEYADNQLRMKNQIVALVEVRSTIESQIKQLKSNELGMQYLSVDSKKGIWRVIYEGLLSSFNTDALEQLIIAGMMIGKDELSVFKEIVLPETSQRVERIESMTRQFGIPV